MQLSDASNPTSGSIIKLCTRERQNKSDYFYLFISDTNSCSSLSGYTDGVKGLKNKFKKASSWPLDDI